MPVEIGDVHDVTQARQGGDDVGDVVTPIDVVAAVAVAVDGDEHGGLDLGEAVDHRAHPELRRTARPDRANRRGGEEGDECLRDVRGVGDDPVTDADAELAQRRGAPTYAECQVVPRQLDRVACLADGDHGDVVRTGRSWRQGLLGVVERCAREPAHSGHRVAVTYPCGWRRPANARELRRRVPETIEVVDRPADQGVEVVDALLCREASKGGGVPGVVGGRPEDLAALH